MADAYKKARKLAERDYHEAQAASHSPYLHALDQMISQEDTSGTERVGVVEIPVSMVVGTRTAGRQRAFSRNFMPLLAPDTEFASKWSKLYTIQCQEGFRDPVKVFEFMHRFYVQEGNKRVSVLKYLDAPTVRADVTRLIPAHWEGLERRLYGEFLEFWRAVPIYDVDFSREGSYRKLAACFGRDLRSPWPDDAVDDLRSNYLYFETVYRSAGGDHLDITPADAMLVYLGFYPGASLLDTPRSTMAARIRKIWGELVLEGTDDNVALVGDPTREAAEAQPDAEPVAKPQKPSSRPARAKGEEGAREGRLMDALTKPLSALAPRDSYSLQRPLRVSFIYKKNAYISRWDLAHDTGREKLEDRFGGLVVTQKHEDCASDRMVRDAIRDSVESGADVVITTSAVQMDETARAAVNYPDVYFLNCSVNLPHQSVRSFFGRTYEVKFLMGALAGSLARNHKVGYRADMPVYGTVADINAFAIGAALVDPSVKVYLEWASKTHADWRREFLDEGVTIISGADAAHPFADDNAYGLFEVAEPNVTGDAGSSGPRGIAGLDSPYPVTNLALPEYDWARYYELIVQSILRGNWQKQRLPVGQKAPSAEHAKAINYWYGISSGVIDVELPLTLPYYSRKLVDMLRDGITKGVIHPFGGELHSQEGLVKGPKDAPLTSAQIVSMDWLNDNVVGSIPDISELTRPAREEVKVSGVAEK